MKSMGVIQGYVIVTGPFRSYNKETGLKRIKIDIYICLLQLELTKGICQIYAKLCKETAKELDYL